MEAISRTDTRLTGRRPRTISSLAADKSGLSSLITVTGIIAVIMSLVIAPLLTFYIPKWTKEAEAGHMDEVSASFTSLHTKIHKMIERNRVNDQSSVRIDLGAETDGVFTSSSTGALSLRPGVPELKIYNSNNSADLYAKSYGSIGYSSRNQQYVDQTYIYENGGVIVEQNNGNTMEVNPDFTIQRHLGAKTLLKRDEIFGNLPGVDTNHPNQIFYNFSGTSEELSISYEVYNNNNTIYENNFNTNVKIVDWTQHSNDWFIESDIDFVKLGAMWTFSEVQPSAYEESSSSLTDLELSFFGSTAHKPGKFGSSIEFDPDSNSRATISNQPEVQLSAAGTVECWVYPYDINGSKIVISKLKESSRSGYQFALLDGEVEFSIGDGTNIHTLTTSDANLRTYEWTHIAGVYDGSKMYIYVNGIQKASKNQTGLIQTNTFKFVLGANQGESSNYYDGRIDEVKIFKKAKTSFDLIDNILSVRGNVGGSVDNCIATVDGSIDTNVLIEVDALVKDFQGHKKNAYIVFDYSNDTAFKFAGIKVNEQKWVIGEKTTSYANYATLNDTLELDKWYDIKLYINNNTVSLYNGTELKLKYTFSQIGFGKFGLANEKSHSHFDNFRVAYNLTNGIEMWLNDNFIGYARTTGILTWDGPFDEFLDETLINEELPNVFEFRNKYSPRKIWALRIVEVKGNLIDVKLSSITIECDERSVSGSDSRTIDLKLVRYELNEYDLRANNITLELTTSYPEAWWGFIESTMNNSLLDLDWRKDKLVSDFYMWMVPGPGGKSTIYLDIKRIAILQIDIAVVKTTIN